MIVLKLHLGDDSVLFKLLLELEGFYCLSLAVDASQDSRNLCGEAGPPAGSEVPLEDDGDGSPLVLEPPALLEDDQGILQDVRGCVCSLVDLSHSGMELGVSVLARGLLDLPDVVAVLSIEGVAVSVDVRNPAS
jgi:hypothetical protein